jgi:replicative DNA helicase
MSAPIRKPSALGRIDELPPLQPAPGRVPPSDLEAEGAVLAAALLDAEALDVVREIIPVPKGTMYADANARILEAAYTLQDKGQPVDIVQVAGLLRDSGRLDQIGGTPYLAQLADATPSVANVADHAQRVREKARLRRMIAVCQVAAAEGYGDVGDATAWLGAVEKAVFESAQEGAAADAAELIGPVLERVSDAIWARRDGGGALGIPCITPQVTRAMMGYRRGKMHVIAARPGVGKTSYALGALVAAARAGYAAIFESAEMDKEELGLRLICEVARIDSRRLIMGELHVGDAARIVDACNELAKLPIALSFRPGATLAQIRGDIRRKLSDLRKKFPPTPERPQELELGEVIVDYIQLLNGERQKGDTREVEVSTLSRGLAWIAGEFNCALLALSQLNRAVETRNTKDKRPTLSDLRESGAIEQDAYTVTGLYRDEYYFKDSPDKGTAEAIYLKNREGAGGMTRLKFTAEYTRFDDLAPDDWAPADYDPGDDYPR